MVTSLSALQISAYRGSPCFTRHLLFFLPTSRPLDKSEGQSLVFKQRL